MADDAQLAARVRNLADPVASELDVDILEVQVKGPKGRRKAQLIVDRADLVGEGLDIDVIAKLSRQLGNVLDEQDPIPGGYTLEVTSPGVDRSLTTARDFARNIGRDVRVVSTDEGAGTVSGTVSSVTDDAVTLEIDRQPVVMPLADVDHGKVVLPW